MADKPLRKVVRHLEQLVGPTASDRQLLERFAGQREESAFATLVERHGPLVWGVCRRVLHHDQDAEDAFQATFHVLARKAPALRWRESVAGWLYEVARRVAHKARVRSARRRTHEQAAAEPGPAAAEAAWQELRPLLDEELGQLPRAYRDPLVLCYLEGKTRDEAAQELGWTVPTLKGRLERGREMLRRRLLRRGLSLSAALFATLLSAHASAAVPTALASATRNAVATGIMTPAVAGLTKGALPTMFTTRFLQIGLAAVVVAVLGAGAAFAAYRAANRAPASEHVAQAKPGDVPDKVRGARMLIGVDTDGTAEAQAKHRAQCEEALKKAGINNIEAVSPNLYLVELRGKKAADVLKDLPNHRGAIVFQDGRLGEAIWYRDPNRQGVFLTPEPFVRFEYPPGDGRSKLQWEAARKKYEGLGLAVEGGAEAGAVPWLKLTPGKGQTLLDVFLLTKPGFHYAMLATSGDKGNQP